MSKDYFQLELNLILMLKDFLLNNKMVLWLWRLPQLYSLNLVISSPRRSLVHRAGKAMETRLAILIQFHSSSVFSQPCKLS